MKEEPKLRSATAFQKYGADHEETPQNLYLSTNKKKQSIQPFSIKKPQNIIDYKVQKPADAWSQEKEESS